MQSWAQVGWVFVGGGIGSAMRYGISRATMAVAGTAAPLGTFVVNVAGCVLMGALAEWFTGRNVSVAAPARMFLATGILGGFTTFSAFAFDAVTLWQRGEICSAAAYATGSVVLSSAGFLGGMMLARTFLAP